VLWRQSDFWRASTANYLRERLSAELGADFQPRQMRGRWFPPGVSLGHVTLHRPGETWVLTAEDVRVSFNLYGILFGRERVGRVVVERPRLFVRARAAPAAAAATGGAPAGGAAAPDVWPVRGGIEARLTSLLRPPFPLRVLEFSGGRVEVFDRDGGRTVANDVDLSMLVSKGSARVELAVGSVAFERSGRSTPLGAVAAEVQVEERRAVVRELTLTGGPVAGRLAGTVSYAGPLRLVGSLTARLDAAASAAGRPGAVSGRVTVEGGTSGNWFAPAAEGTVTGRDLAFAGTRWPEAKGRFSWAGKGLAVTDLRVGFGEGSVVGAGEVDFAAEPPRYRVTVEARNVDLERVPATPGPAAARVRGISGVARWEGEGFGAAAAGGGRVEARCALSPDLAEEVAVQADAALGPEGLSIGAFRVATRSLEAAGSASWRRGAGLTGRLAGTVADLGRLFPSAGIGGRGTFEGDIVSGVAGPGFHGKARIAAGSLAAVRGIEGESRVVADRRGVQLVDATVAWPGGRGGASGIIELPSGRLDLVGVLDQLSVAEAARLLGADPARVGGEFGARLRVRGTLAAPEADGDIVGRDVRYDAAALDEVALSFTYVARRLEVPALRFRRGSTRFTFHGAVRPDRTLEGQFASPAFDLADFAPGGALELAGSLGGSLDGALRDPRVKARLQATRLRYHGLDFKGGELAVAYGGGTLGVEGWVAVPENRLRLVIEPARDWRFDADLELRQLAPELVRSGAAALPGFSRALGRSSLLASGRFQARGRLREPASVQADLVLETLWLQAAGKMLQNRKPVRLRWRDGGFEVEDFALAGDQYHLDVSGGGSLAAGWKLRAEGSVDLALAKDYWRDLEDVSGNGELRLTVGGAWARPLVEGSVSVSGAFAKIRQMPEPVERLQGRIEARGGVYTATELSGRIGGGPFSGRGTYDSAADRLEAEVEGRLDLALFRASVPAARELRGPAEVRLRLEGPIAAPSIRGDLEILDAEANARAFPAKFTHVRGRVRLGADRLDIDELTGQIGGGTVRLAGALDWSHPPARVTADLTGTGVTVSLAGALKTQSDLRLSLRGDLADLRLAGELHILKARYSREFDEKPPALGGGGSGGSGGSPSSGGEGGGPDLSRMALDVAVRATDNVWIDNKTAKIEAAVALQVGGTLGAPVVRGEITGIQGEAIYLSRQFRLESGSLRFVPPEKVPLLDLQASTTVGEVQILFLMDGPVNHPAYHLTSLPGMPQEDLVTLLTIGETRAGLARRGERATTAGAAVFTTEPLVNALGDEVRSVTGLETLQVEPIVGDSQQVSARVTLGTHLSDRLFVSYSQNLGATEDQQVAVQYYLLDYLSLWGQELRQGIYSLDLVFRYSFK
jgi:autotransporter translocation and assembly factor TamB